MTIVLSSSIVSLTIEPTSYAEALERIAAGKPTYWLKQWSDRSLSHPVDFQHIGSNSPMYTMSWEPLEFPSTVVEGEMTQPVKGRDGWWFGRPSVFAEQIYGTAKWWTFLGRSDAYKLLGLHAGLDSYRQLLAQGEDEYDWVVDPMAAAEYATAWAFGRALQIDSTLTHYVAVEGAPAIEILTATDPLIKTLLGGAVNRGLEPRVYGVQRRSLQEY